MRRTIGAVFAFGWLFARLAFGQLPTEWQTEFIIRQYDYERFNQVLRATTGTHPADANRAVIGQEDAQWEVIRTVVQAAPDASAWDVQYTFRLMSGSVPAASVGLRFRVGGWQTENYVFSPAALYNGNCFQSQRIDYSPRLMHPRDVGLNVPPIITDVPRLNIADGLSCVQFTSGAATMPAMGYYQPAARRGFLITAAQGNALGDYGLEIEESRDRKTAWFTLTSPHVRELYKYQLVDNQFPTDDKPRDFRAGDSVTIACRVYAWQTPDLAAYFARYFELHHRQVRELTFTPRLPFSAAFDLIEDKYNRRNWNAVGFYASDAIETNRHWKPGWVSGTPAAYALWLGNKPQTRQRVLRQNNWLLPDGIAPSGYFYERCLDGTQWIGGDLTKFHTHQWHLVRSSADGLYYAFQLLNKMEADKHDPAEIARWQAHLQKVADAFLKTWNRYGQHGHWVHTQTGEIVVGGSASGAIVPAALVMAAERYQNPAYLQAATDAAEMFHREFVAKGITTGGPGDALQNPDSESCYALLESFMKLYEATRQPQWLQYAQETAHLFATWVMPYHYAFPPNSLMGRLKAESGGTVWANTQNKHSAPGICTASGLALLKLYRATGNRAYLDLLRAIAQAIPQYVSTAERPIGKLPVGCVDERVSTNDWLEGNGEIANISTWAEIAMMLTAQELPGVYVVRKQKQISIFDHVEAQLMQKRGALFLQVRNPTAYAAKVRIAIDDADLPLADTTKGMREIIVELPAGKSAEIKI